MNKKLVFNNLRMINLQFSLLPCKDFFGNLITKNKNNIKSSKYSLKCQANFKKIPDNYYHGVDTHLYLGKFNQYFKSGCNKSIWFSCINENLSYLNKFNINHDTIINYMTQNYMGTKISNQYLTFKTLDKESIKSVQKNYNVDLWLIKDCPLSVSHLNPIFELISAYSDQIGQIRNLYNANTHVFQNSFITEILIPIGYGLKLSVKFRNLQMRTPSQELFNLSNYIRMDDVCVCKTPIKFKNNNCNDINAQFQRIETSNFLYRITEKSDERMMTLQNEENSNLREKSFEFLNNSVSQDYYNIYEKEYDFESGELSENPLGKHKILSNFIPVVSLGQLARKNPDH